MNSLPTRVRSQLIGSCRGEGGRDAEPRDAVLRVGAALLARVAGPRRAEVVRDEEAPERPEDPLPEGFPEAPLDVRVAMLGRLTRRVVNCATTRRKPREAAPPFTGSVDTP
ncbi:hypothetical protein GCM10017559_73610 [Streptosporangium longisporum]|uniref:Uncharacterized protein n=1 Tax=Streptosporangium longisporum TaxID=46187 RepID=A0ABP6L7P1_9ACTN